MTSITRQKKRWQRSNASKRRSGSFSKKWRQWQRLIPQLELSATQKGGVIVGLLVMLIAVSVYNNVDFESVSNKMHRGDIYYSQGSYEEAIVIWKQIIKKNPMLVAPHMKIGQAYIKLADWTHARKHFEKALRIAPDSLDSALELIKTDLLTGNLADAERRCMRLKQKAPNDPEINAVAGDLMVLQGELELAEYYYRTAVLSEPDSVRYALKMAVCLIAQNRQEDADRYAALAKKIGCFTPNSLTQLAEYYLLSDAADQAEHCLQKALEMEPENLKVKVRLAQLYFLMGTLDKAESLLVDLIAVHKENLVFKKMLADTYISLKKMNDAEKVIADIKSVVGNDDPGYNTLQGKYWMYKGNPVYAATHLKSALDEVPGLITAQYYLSVAYLAADQKQLAENSVTQTLMYDPDHTDSQLLMAAILQRKGKYALSDKYLDQVMAMEIENYRAYMLKALNAMALGAYDRAISLLRLAGRLDPQAVEPLYYLGVSYERLAHPETALTFYEKAFEIDSGRVDLIYRYMMLLIKVGRQDKAKKIVATQLTTHSDQPYFYYVAGQMWLEIGDEARATEVLQQALSRLKCPVYFYFRLAELYSRNGESGNALKVLGRCLQAYPYNKEAWVTMAKYFVESGDLDEAIKQLEKAEKKLPFEPEILSNLAWLYLETDSNLDMALEYARSAYDKMPNNPAIGDTLGWAYYKKGSYGQASWVLGEIEDQGGDSERLLFHLGMALYKEGRLYEALERFNKIIALETHQLDPSELDQVSAHIDKIQNKDFLDSEENLEEKGIMAVQGVDSDLFEFPDKFLNEEEDIIIPEWSNENPQL